jgi:hypothetical protein
MNLLLCGTETWLLRKSQLDKLEYFFTAAFNPSSILMTKVQEQCLCNNKVQEMFYSIPCIRKMIVAQQMDFVGKMKLPTAHLAK